LIPRLKAAIADLSSRKILKLSLLILALTFWISFSETISLRKVLKPN